MPKIPLGLPAGCQLTRQHLLDLKSSLDGDPALRSQVELIIGEEKVVELMAAIVALDVNSDHPAIIDGSNDSTSLYKSVNKSAKVADFSDALSTNLHGWDASSEDSAETRSELDNKELTGRNIKMLELYLKLRNAILLSRRLEAKSFEVKLQDLQPLTNLEAALSKVRYLENFTQHNPQLKSMVYGNRIRELGCIDDVDYCWSADSAVNYHLTADSAVSVIVNYHLTRNLLLSRFFEDLSNLSESLDRLDLLNVDILNSSQYNDAVLQLKSFLTLGWSDQVEKLEDSKYNIGFVHIIHNFWEKLKCSANNSSATVNKKRSATTLISEQKENEYKRCKAQSSINCDNEESNGTGEENILVNWNGTKDLIENDSRLTPSDMIKLEPLEDFNVDDYQKERDDEEEQKQEEEEEEVVDDVSDLFPPEDFLSEEQHSIEELIEFNIEFEPPPKSSPADKACSEVGNVLDADTRENTAPSDDDNVAAVGSSNKPTGSRLFRCQVTNCDGVFTRAWYLKVHTAKVHCTAANLLLPPSTLGRRGTGGGCQVQQTISRCLACTTCSYLTPEVELMGQHVAQLHSGGGGEAGTSHSDNPGYEIIFRDSEGNVVTGAENISGLKVFSCNFCGHLSNKTSNIKQHLSYVHKEVAVSPDAPGYQIFKKVGLEPGQEKRVCKLAGGRVRTKDKSVLDPELSCGICEYSTRWSAALTNHIMAVHQDGTGFHCADCLAEFGEKEEYEEHVRTAHAPKVFICDQCDYQAAREEYLRRHIKIHHCGFRYSCPQCDFTAKCSSSLADHTKSVHMGQLYQCEECDWKGSHRSSLAKHVRFKHQKQRVTCPYCQYQAKGNSSLKKHLNSKHEKTWILCDKCNFKGVDKATVHKHQLFSHTLPVYSCTTCPFETEVKEECISHAREKHMLVLDENGGLYSCNICQYTSKTKGGLNKHIEHLHSGTLYPCPSNCGYKSPNPWTLRRHAKSQHQVELDISQLRAAAADLGDVDKDGSSGK